MTNTTFWTNVKQYGNEILYIGYENGNRVKEKIKFKPSLFVEANNNDVPAFRSLFGSPLHRLDFDSIKDAKEHLKLYHGMQNYRIYGTDRFANQFLAEKFKPRNIEYLYKLIRIYSLDIEVFSGNGFPDPYKAQEPVTAITIHDSKDDKFHTWTMKPYDENHQYTSEKPDPIKALRPKVTFHKFNSEGEMLYDFVQFWEANFPDIVTGWNVRFFDMLYIYNRILKLYGEKIAGRLSPWGLVSEKTSSIMRFGTKRDEQYYEVSGVAELDLLDLYKKYANTEETYKLGHIAKVNLGIDKVEYDGSLHQLYERDYQKYIDYNIQDTNIVVELERKLKLIALIVEVSYMAKVPSYTDSLGTVKYWETYIYHHLLRENQLAEITHPNGMKDRQYAGAYVKEPQGGMFEYVVTFDFSSLYPTTIRQTNIGFESLVDLATIPSDLRELLANTTVENIIDRKLDTSILKKYNYSLSANGQLYRREKPSFFSAMLKEVMDGRKTDKKLMLEAKKEFERTKDFKFEDAADMFDIKQRAKKTLGNGFYGGTGNAYFQFFNIDNAEAVTLTGQVFIKSVVKRVNEFLNTIMKTQNVDFVIAGDTDSVFLNLGPLVKLIFKNDLSNRDAILNFMDAFCKEKLTPLIDKTCQELFEYLNHYENLMDMKREKIVERGVWTGKKKRYFLSIYDSEGVRYKEPEIYVTGIQSVSTATPELCRDALSEAFRIILTENQANLQKFVKEFKTKFWASPIEKIAFPRGVNDAEKYTARDGNYIEGTPAHIRAAVLYNKMLTTKGLTKVKEKIDNGSKIKWVYLIEPNSLHENVMAFIDKLPKEFELDKYVDYNKQYEKTFLEPLKNIVEVFGWNTEEVNTLESLFA